MSRNAAGPDSRSQLSDLPGQMEEALNNPEFIALRDALIDRLRRQAPWGYKCVFLNCEVHETPGGMTTSGDLFAVTKPLIGGPKRNRWVLDSDATSILNKMAALVLRGSGQDHAALDLLFYRRGECKVFVDRGPLNRIGGKNRYFKSKHKVYATIEPLLQRID
jgi:hypothetical protein